MSGRNADKAIEAMKKNAAEDKKKQEENKKITLTF